MANTSKRDYYEVLGVNKTASDDEIKKGYKQMARKYHPDLNPGDKGAEEKFKEVNEAYEILSNPSKRENYDRYGFAGVDPNFNPGGAGGWAGTRDPFSDLEDLFKGFGGFGGFGFDGASANNVNQKRNGDDVQVSIRLTFEEAAKGCVKEINYVRVDECTKCGGSGCVPGTQSEPCTDCNSTGWKRVTRSSPLGVMQTTSPCDKCKGRGKIIKTPCKSCGGMGTVKSTRKLQVNIPAGISEGQSIVLHNEGSVGVNGGKRGDAYVYIAQVMESKDGIRRIEGTNNTEYEKHVSFVEAALGAKIQVPSLDGTLEYKIPHGSQTGQVFRLKGRGIQRLNKPDERGDHMIRIVVDVPKHLTGKAKRALKEFARALGESTDNITDTSE